MRDWRQRAPKRLFIGGPLAGQKTNRYAEYLNAEGARLDWYVSLKESAFYVRTEQGYVWRTRRF